VHKNKNVSVNNGFSQAVVPYKSQTEKLKTKIRTLPAHGRVLTIFSLLKVLSVY
jgi:hypothetical protein